VRQALRAALASIHPGSEQRWNALVEGWVQNTRTAARTGRVRRLEAECTLMEIAMAAPPGSESGQSDRQLDPGLGLTVPPPITLVPFISQTAVWPFVF
jgi:hypothetical protein